MLRRCCFLKCDDFGINHHVAGGDVYLGAKMYFLTKQRHYDILKRLGQFLHHSLHVAVQRKRSYAFVSAGGDTHTANQYRADVMLSMNDIVGLTCQHRRGRLRE